MAEGHGLADLQMGEAGHDRDRHALGLLDQRRLQIGQICRSSASIASRTQERKSSRDLVVARAGGVQPSRRGADQLGQPRLDIHVDVFELRAEGEAAALDLAREFASRPRRWPRHRP